MEIQPATLAQVRQGRDGRSVLVEDDVLDVARQLREISDDLRLRWNEQGYFVVYQQTMDGERLVLTSQSLTPAIVERVREIANPKYDLVAEMDRMDKQAEKDKEDRFRDQVGERGEVLAHALRRDLQDKSKIILPRGI